MRKIVFDSIIVGLFIGGLIRFLDGHPVIIGFILVALTVAKGLDYFGSVDRLKEEWTLAKPSNEKLVFAQDLVNSVSKLAKLQAPELYLYVPTTKGAVMAATGGYLKPTLLCSVPFFELPLNQVKGVLLHELGHIHYKHVLLAELVDYISFFLVSGLIFEVSVGLSMLSTLGISILGFGFRNLITVAYSHYCEYQADRFSQKYAPDCLLEFLADYNDGKPQSWFEPHPSIQARIAAIF